MFSLYYLTKGASRLPFGHFSLSLSVSLRESAEGQGHVVFLSVDDFGLSHDLAALSFIIRAMKMEPRSRLAFL